MEEQLATGYRCMTDGEQDIMAVSGKKFFVHVAGKTNNAHQEMVKNLRGIGRKQVSSFEESDFVVVFCPVVSRVGTDIDAALKGIPGGKPTILVVMHHTFDPEHIVAPSRRQVEDPNVRLTVDCLFHEGSLLDCDLNRGANEEVLGSPRSAVPLRRESRAVPRAGTPEVISIDSETQLLYSPPSWRSWWSWWSSWSWWSWLSGWRHR